MTDPPAPLTRRWPHACARTADRWLLLGTSFAIMAIIGVYQYSWFLFAFRLHQDLGWSLSSIGLVYTTFQLTSTLVMPLSGYIADARGPRSVAALAALLAGGGFVLCALLPFRWSLVASYGLGGLGTGVLYGISTAIALKWFPDRRGFATGLAVFGFGAGTAVFNIGIERLLGSTGLTGTFLMLGIAMTVALVPLAFLVRYPDQAIDPERIVRAGAESPQSQFTPREMLRTGQWHVMYWCFCFTMSIVLIFGAQMKAIAAEYALPVSYFSALLILFPLANGLSRVAAGTLSDRIGRPRTMQLFYTVLSGSIFGLIWLGQEPALFLLFVILAALCGGAPFALYPAAIGDLYGARFSTANYGLTYTAKAWAGLISGWLSGYLAGRFGSFTVPLLSVGVFSLLAAVVSHPRFMSVPSARRG